MGDIYLTSDLHVGHDNIVKYCNRPCTIENHDEFLVESLNSHIKPNDTVYHIGDFTIQWKGQENIDKITNFINKLNGRWIFIKGNHDNARILKEIINNTTKKHEFFGSDYFGIIKDVNVHMYHFPIDNWDKMGYGGVHFHGHTHNKSPEYKPNRFSVCFDLEFRPFNFDEFEFKTGREVREWYETINMLKEI